MYELFMLKGKLYIYKGKVTIDEHLSGQVQPSHVINNLMPTVGRVYTLTESLSNIDEVRLGDDNTARVSSDMDLYNPLFTAYPTDKRVVGTKRITELFVGVNEANFMHREIGIFAEGALISTLVMSDFEKTTAKTRTYIHEMGWL
jgi:hypothetical protein